MARNWTWTLSSEQLREFWKRKNLHLLSHHIEVRLSITGKPEAPAIIEVKVEDPPTVPPEVTRELLPNARARRT